MPRVTGSGSDSPEWRCGIKIILLICAIVGVLGMVAGVESLKRHVRHERVLGHSMFHGVRVLSAEQAGYWEGRE